MADEQETTQALVPVPVRPPTAVLPSMDEIGVMTAIAKNFAKLAGRLIPKQIDSPEAAFAVLYAGFEVGVPATVAFRHFFIVNGRTEPDSQIMMGLVMGREPGADFIIHENTNKACDLELRRPYKQPTRLRYEIGDVPRGLLNKPLWKEIPRDMLAWYTAKRVCRLGASDLINAVGGGIAVEEAAELVQSEALPAEALPAAAEPPTDTTPDAPAPRIAHGQEPRVPERGTSAPAEGEPPERDEWDVAEERMRTRDGALPTPAAVNVVCEWLGIPTTGEFPIRRHWLRVGTASGLALEDVAALAVEALNAMAAELQGGATLDEARAAVGPMALLRTACQEAAR